MITPAFSGIYTATSGILASEAALNTISNNVTNANTAGYSEETVQQTEAAAYAQADTSDSLAQGQIGEGVLVTGITRSHNNLIDSQIQGQNSQYNYQNTISTTLQQAQGFLANTSDTTGSPIGDALNSFFTAAQALSNNPSDSATRTNFIQSAQSMLSTFQSQATDLQNIRTSLVGNAAVAGSFSNSQAALTVNAINTSLTQVAALNKQIAITQGAGASANTLLDQRDQLLSTLSQDANITVSYQNNNQVNVTLGSNTLVQGTKVVNTLQAVQNTGASPAPDNTPTNIELSSNNNVINSDITGGTLGGILQVGGNAAGTTTIRSLMGNLDTLFGQIATQVNSLQAAGMNLSGTVPTSGTDDQIFVPGTGTGLSLFQYTMNSNIVQDPTQIAAAIDDSGSFDGVGDGRNAASMANIATQANSALGNQTPTGYLSNQLSNLGTATQNATSTATTNNNILQQLQQQQTSVQGVNVDQELANMLRYQQGYSASAKIMTTIETEITTILTDLTTTSG